MFGKRIKKEQKQILKKIEEYLKDHPEQRVGQAITNLTENREINMHLYHVSDFEFLRLIKENTTKKWWTFLLILLPLMSFSQVDTVAHKGEIKVVMTIPYAKNIEYWGQKGVISTPLIQGLETRIMIMESKLGFHEMINRNCTKAQEEYRLMLQNAAGVNLKLQQEIVDSNQERDVWKSKARNRGQLISFGAVILGLLGYIQISN